MPDVVPFAQAARQWFFISLQTFGGPAGQIAVMHRYLVEERRWIGERRFQHALNYCMLLPGPEAQQLAIYTGWLLNGLRGGLTAGVLFVLPGMLALLVLSAIYVRFGDTSTVTALLGGVAPAIVVIVGGAVVGLARRALKSAALVAIAVAAFIAISVLGVPFPLVICGSAAAGWLLDRGRPGSTESDRQSSGDDGPPPLIPDDALHRHASSHRRTVRILVIGLILWLVPVAAAMLLTGPDSVYTTQGLFFSGTAMVTFGGAYAVLAFVSQQAVNTYGWLSAGDMVRGLALAESTPGPLIMVVQFVAFLGAYHDPGSLSPWVAGVVASLLTTWVTFVPCFMFVLVGAPYIERLRSSRTLSATLTGITAAVVGVIASLAIYFATHTLFGETFSAGYGPVELTLPEAASIRPAAVALTILAGVLIFKLRWSALRVIGVCAAVGLAATGWSIASHG